MWQETGFKVVVEPDGDAVGMKAEIVIRSNRLTQCNVWKLISVSDKEVYPEGVCPLHLGTWSSNNLAELKKEILLSKVWEVLAGMDAALLRRLKSIFELEWPMVKMPFLPVAGLQEKDKEFISLEQTEAELFEKRKSLTPKTAVKKPGQKTDEEWCCLQYGEALRERHLSCVWFHFTPEGVRGEKGVDGYLKYLSKDGSLIAEEIQVVSAEEMGPQGFRNLNQRKMKVYGSPPGSLEELDVDERSIEINRPGQDRIRDVFGAVKKSVSDKRNKFYDGCARMTLLVHVNLAYSILGKDEVFLTFLDLGPYKDFGIEKQDLNTFKKVVVQFPHADYLYENGEWTKLNRYP